MHTYTTRTWLIYHGISTCSKNTGTCAVGQRVSCTSERSLPWADFPHLRRQRNEPQRHSSQKALICLGFGQSCCISPQSTFDHDRSTVFSFLETQNWISRLPHIFFCLQKWLPFPIFPRGTRSWKNDLMCYCHFLSFGSLLLLQGFQLCHVETEHPEVHNLSGL